MSMPGVVRNGPRWLFDPVGPLALRWSYPAIAPWLVRFIRAGTPEKVHAQARALRPLVGPSSNPRSRHRDDRDLWLGNQHLELRVSALNFSTG